ncbi:unnamed protein product [Toxocara canis]|uniref:Uncharacterized protein n=1 Tax=Toxocara canis TaxID=6265 RepID=A0A183U202_TOXCA|nr:unnamed protein product [Toxocara canis]
MIIRSDVRSRGFDDYFDNRKLSAVKAIENRLRQSRVALACWSTGCGALVKPLEHLICVNLMSSAITASQNSVDFAVAEPAKKRARVQEVAADSQVCYSFTRV